MDSIKNYVNEIIPKGTEWMCSLENYASEHRVPIMEKDSMHFLTQLVRIKQPASILEIGTAIGYSALRMHEACGSATITTLEKNETMYNQAVANIHAQGKSEQIHVLLGDAEQSLEELTAQKASFDFIFIDAAKGQYKNYFTLVQPLIRPHGIIVCDNVLFKGYVADEKKNDNKRLQKIAVKVRSFNAWLMEQGDYHTSIIPVGDGVSISVKLNEASKK